MKVVKEEFVKRMKYIEEKSKGFKTCFTISNTSKEVEEFYFTPIRSREGVFICGVVVPNVTVAIQFAELVDGRFDFVAVDAEKKIDESRFSFVGDEGNIKGEVQDRIKKSKFITFKANDLTVEAVDTFLCEKIKNKSKVNISVIGMGNIGFKIAQKLVERGYNVKCFRRNYKDLKIQVESINITKPRGTNARAYACERIEEALEKSDVVLATANSSDVIGLSHVHSLHQDVVFVDCGKSCFHDDVLKERLVFRTDVSFSLLYTLKMIIEFHDTLFPKYGVKIIDNRRYVSGVCGSRGDIVVTDIHDPVNSVIGVCDGVGGISLKDL